MKKEKITHQSRYVTVGIAEVDKIEKQKLNILVRVLVGSISHRRRSSLGRIQAYGERSAYTL